MVKGAPCQEIGQNARGGGCSCCRHRIIVICCLWRFYAARQNFCNFSGRNESLKRNKEEECAYYCMKTVEQKPKYSLNEEQEKKLILREYRALLRALKDKIKPGDKDILRRAFEMAADAHSSMRRKSGEPYILHPIAVAKICVEEIGLGVRSTVCALLHDTVEDTDITLQDIEREFGSEIARIVDGLTKISNVIDSSASQQAENFKKILLTLTDDPRVILIKLADRLNNMRTLDSMKREKQLKIASETVYIFAPLAHRMGLYSIKTELEDLAMKYLEPDTYKEIAKKAGGDQTRPYPVHQ